MRLQGRKDVIFPIQLLHPTLKQISTTLFHLLLDLPDPLKTANSVGQGRLELRQLIVENKNPVTGFLLLSLKFFLLLNQFVHYARLARGKQTRRNQGDPRDEATRTPSHDRPRRMHSLQRTERPVSSKRQSTLCLKQ
ncbi:hypothetical protein NM208_g9601 [Fusarium decemcellulare]|uniref:Uncharacterized protein n=1 Tax=Fusarium decemcellulare TaxID=57161 RepID=A0ACC1S0Y0_9HYPO|nr:hypothetical protein NM208_g9601 [Fusarium decemcellulare]